MKSTLEGSGLGFRRELLPHLQNNDLNNIDFFEVAPENWIDVGGQYKEDLKSFSERFPFVCHGLSLSIGSADPLDTDLLKKIKVFIKEHNVQLYTEHLSWCSYNGHLYDLLPIPCTEEAVHWVSKRIKQTQDILEQQIAIENASYYFVPPSSSMQEQDFISAIIKESNCLLHLDVNNVYVNSQNFKFDPQEYINALPLDKVCYLHMAGHYIEEDGIIVDTHGANVVESVWKLLDYTYDKLPFDAKSVPTCLERDFNFDDFQHILSEVEAIRKLQSRTRLKEQKSA